MFKHGVLKIFHSVMIEPQVGHFAANCLLFVLSSLVSSDYELGSGGSKLLVCPQVLPLICVCVCVCVCVFNF